MEKEKEEILMAMGVLLISLQTAEKILKATISYILPRNGSLTLESLTKQEKEEQKKTLGYFINELRERADIDPSFDANFSEFLDMRNEFIHDLDRVPGFTFSSKEGLIVAAKYINKLMELTDNVTKVLIALGLAWQKQNSIKFEEIDNHAFFLKIDREITPFVNDIFIKKRPTQKI